MTHKNTYLPLYPHSAAYARNQGEIIKYRASHEANISCRDAIEKAIRDHYKDNILNPAAAEEVLLRFGPERTLHVLAETVRHKTWDGRISKEHKAWAQSVPSFDDTDRWGYDRTEDYVLHQAHPGLIDLFITQIQKAEKEFSTVSPVHNISSPGKKSHSFREMER